MADKKPSPAASWSPGDTVRLVSGGPVMVIRSFTKPEPGVLTRVNCQWFAADGLLQRASFLPEQLVRVDPPART
jgi:uncharacterized protein YodC (DUF2158 family)